MRTPTVVCFLGTALLCGCNKGESVATEEAAEVAVHVRAATVGVGTGCWECAPEGARQHYEIIDPQDDLFVTYWEKYYDVGFSSLDLFKGGYRLDVNYIDPNVPPDPNWPRDTNNVSGKGQRYCYGDVFDWTVDPGQVNGVLWLGVYGWLESPLVEYYIGRDGQWNDVCAGEYETSRGTYRLYVQGFARANIHNPEDDPSRPRKFLQYNVKNVEDADPGPWKGPVDLSEHFAAWDGVMAAFLDGPASCALRRWAKPGEGIDCNDFECDGFICENFWNEQHTWDEIQQYKYCCGFYNCENFDCEEYPSWAEEQARFCCEGYDWHKLEKTNYCVVATEVGGNGNASAIVSNISVTAKFPQTIDGTCDGVDNDADGVVDDDWKPGICILPPTHPTCGNGTHFGTTACSGGVESCVPEAAGTTDVCDGEDNDCDGSVDEDFVPSTRNCGTEVGRCQNKETLTCAGAGGEVWGACEDGPDRIREVACNNEDDDCDGRTDEGSINLPIKCVLDRDEDGIEDGLDTQPDTYSNEFGEADFGTTSGVIVNRGDQTVVVFDPPSGDGVRVETLAPGGTRKAEISLCGGTVTLTMGPGEKQVVTCPETACLFASEQLRVLDRGKVWSDFYAGSFILQWDVKVCGAGLSTGNGRLFDRAGITGGATLGGTLSGYRAGVTPLVEGARVAPQVLRVFSIVVAGADVRVPDNGTTTLSPGDYGDVVVGAGGTLVLNAAGTYRFNTLTFASDSHLDLTAAGADAVTLAVEGNLVLGDHWEKLGSAQINAYANGASVVAGYGSKLSASIQAPFAIVEVRDRAQVNGCIKGRRVTLGYDTQLHGASSGGPGPGPAVLSAHLTKTGDWGGDYCVTIDVTNSGGSSTGWVATINTGRSSIYSRRNGRFSGTWGTVTAAPNQSWNLTIDPGETDTSVGFCAHRWIPGEMATLVSIAPLLAPI
jgi:hypothetical protein